MINSLSAVILTSVSNHRTPHLTAASMASRVLSVPKPLPPLCAISFKTPPVRPDSSGTRIVPERRLPCPSLCYTCLCFNSGGAMKSSERRRILDRLKNVEERMLMVVNPVSKKGTERASDVRRMARREGMDLEETSTDHPDDVGSTIEFWSKRFGGSRVIMVVGGDGAINQVVNNVMLSRSNKNVVLAPVPAGTANDFCRAMHLRSVEDSLEAMADFNVRTIDVIKMEIEGVKNQLKY